MLNKIKSKINKKLAKEKEFVIDTLSKKSVKMILLGDYVNKRNKYKNEINDYFKYFLDNYIIVCKYLKKDFKRKKIYDGDDLDQEIEDMERVQRNYSRGIFKNNKFFKKINPIVFQNDLDKWKILNDLFIYYPKILSQLKHHVFDTDTYKEISFSKEYEKLEEAKFLKEDFSAMIKQILKDECQMSQTS